VLETPKITQMLLKSNSDSGYVLGIALGACSKMVRFTAEASVLELGAERCILLFIIVK